MSRLLVDVGNTRIKWAVQTEQGLIAQQSLPHDAISDEQLRQRLLGNDVMTHGVIAEVLIANVAGERWRERLLSVVQACYGLSPRFITSAGQIQVAGKWLRNAYSEPHKLGVDRWLAMQAAVRRVPDAHLLVVSLGTALTLDALDITGQHLGGLIVPGAALMMSSLMQGTSDIAAFASNDALQSGRWFGDNTLSCVALGAQHAASAMIAAAHAQMTAEGRKARLCITGGGAASLSLPDYLQTQVLLINDLVLEGLSLH